MVGLCIGMIRFILEFSYTVPPCGSGEFLIDKSISGKLFFAVEIEQ